MDALVVTGWSDFFVAAAGAAAALAGLVFVSLSINLARIIASPGMSGRAAETIIVLAGALIGALVALIPHLSSRAWGLALLVVALPTWIGPMIIQARAAQAHAYSNPWQVVMRAVLHQAATLPGLVAGASLIGFLPGGVGWFAAGVLISILVAMVNAWVLLVEILR